MSDRKLFSPAAIAAHTVFFTPAVGGLMAAVNWKRLGDVKQARTAAAIGVGATAILMAVAALWPAKWGNSIQGGVTGAAAAMAFAFYKQSKPPFEAHLAQGGKKAAFWPATLGGFALLLLLLGGATVVTLFSPGHAAFNAGVEALQRDDNAAAERDFIQVLQLAPDDDAARYNLGLALARQGKPEDARAQLEKIGPESPFAVEAHRLLREISALPPPK